MYPNLHSHPHYSQRNPHLYMQASGSPSPSVMPMEHVLEAHDCLCVSGDSAIALTTANNVQLAAAAAAAVLNVQVNPQPTKPWRGVPGNRSCASYLIQQAHMHTEYAWATGGLVCRQATRVCADSPACLAVY